MKKKLTGLSAASVLAILMAGSAAAQTSDPGANSRVDTGAIVVTAQRREQRLQDVGLSVTAFSAETLQNLGVDDSTAIAEFVPNLEIGDPLGAGSQPAIFIRGIGLNDFNSNNAGPNGVYVDEVYISSPSAQAFQIFDLDRVEVLRGPQGTLYGRNTTGGAINFITARPTASLTASGRLSYGSFDTVTAEGAVSGPLSDDVRARVAAIYNYGDGYILNRVTGNRNNGTSNFAGRLLIDADASDNFALRFNLHGGSLDTTAPQYRSQGVLDPATGAPCSVSAIQAGGCTDALGYGSPTDLRTGDYNREGDLTVDSWGGSLTAEWNVGDVTLVSLSAYEYLDKLQQEETDASPNRLLELDYGTTSETFTQELRANGETDSMRWLVGLYYLWEEIDQNQTADLFRDLRPLVESIDPVAFPGGFDPDGASGVAPIFFSRTLNSQRTESVAAYAQVEYDITDRLQVTLGGRYTKESRDFTSSLTFEEPSFDFPVFAITDGLDNDDFSWRLALDYQATDDVLLYASYATGFKSGGFNGGVVFDPVALAPIGEESLAAYELGFKSQFANRRVTLNAAAFYYDYSDLQVFTLVNTGGVPTQILDNAADAKITGFEVEFVAEPVDDLRFNIGLGYLDTELQNFQSGTGLDLSGNRLALAPKWSLSAIASYDWQLGAGTLRAQGSLSYRSHIFFSTENNPLIAQDGYTLLGARLQYDSPDKSWHAAVFGENLADTDYLTYAVDLSDFGFNQLMVAPGRSFGGEVGFKF